jgi:IclR family transcriptional regulator, pca regulon regulatory protein
MRTLQRRPAPTAGRLKVQRGERDFVTALARGLDVMRAFSGQQAEQLALADVAKLVALPRATVRRSLITLCALGYMEESDKRFRLAPKVLTLAQAYLSSNLLPRIARPLVERVSAELAESCSVSILHETEVIYVARSTNKRLSALLGDVGSRRPAYCTSMGRVLLAHLPERSLEAYFRAVELKPLTAHTIADESELRALLVKIRKQEFCLSDQQMELDLRTIAVPLRNNAGQVVAAMHASTQASRTTKQQMIQKFLPVLREAATEIRALLV